jgi:hypothetical protein
MKKILFIFAILSLISPVRSQTMIPEGEVHGLWESYLSPYLVTGNIHIPHGMNLTIEPGVRVEFQGHFQLKVMGSLTAEGTQQDTIVFTVNDTTGFSMPDTSLGGWYGIRIYDIDPENDSTKLAYCRLEFGKAIGPVWFLNAGGALCVIEFDKVSVSNCLFENNMAVGPQNEFPAGGAVHMAWSDVVFKHNTFRHNRAHAGGAIQFHDSDPVFIGNHFTRNRCGWDGGALSSGGGSSPSFSGDVFHKNHSDQLGGGLNIGGPCDVTMENITVTGNEANWGGGIGIQSGDVEILNSVISDNMVTWLGGGISADGSMVTIRNSVLENDSSLTGAGAIHSWQGTLNLEGVEFLGNSAWHAGAVNADWTILKAKSCLFRGNLATEIGGALKVFNSHMFIDSCILDGNISLLDAGAIDYAADTMVFDSLFVVRITDTRILKNHANRAAGGLSIQQTHTRKSLVDVMINRSEIGHNTARQVGGFRIIRCPSTVTLSNSLITKNRSENWTGGGSIAAESEGRVYNCVFYDNHAALVSTAASSGGFGVSNSANVDLFNCTFVGNSAGVGGGVMVRRGGTAIVTNSVFWGNQPQQLGLSAVYDSLPCSVILNYNDIQFGPDSIRVTDTVSRVTFGVGNVDTNPLFMDPIQADFRLLEISPLIGAGIGEIEIEGTWYYCPDHDMDGNPRPQPGGSRPDMGAYENDNPWPLGIRETVSKPDQPDMRIYPNPFSREATIEFPLDSGNPVQIEIYSMSGRYITTLKAEEFEPGIHKVNWCPGNLPGGVYFTRLVIGSLSGSQISVVKPMLYLDQ